MPSSALDGLTTITSDFITVHRDGVLVAFLEYDWVQDRAYMLRADRGEPTEGEEGETLYVSNIVVNAPDPRLIWALRKRLPPHRYIVGLDAQYNLHSPKGLPDGFLS